jgi:haloalkane dehalogenase
MKSIAIPQNLKEEYPFESNFFEVAPDTHLHYVDEGRDNEKILVMVHGNPTWSFFYRNLIKKFSKTHRVIAVDHIGCGLSSKPQDYDYSLKNHIENLSQLFRQKVLTINPNARFDLIVHDWGGAIGSGFALNFKERLDKMVIMNTAAFTDTFIPKRINLCKLPVVGEPMVRAFNAFAWPATFMAVNKPLPKTIKSGYLLPYDNYQNRIATARFVKDIPMNDKHPTWATLKEIENGLKGLEGKKLILWGEKDFCFTPHFFKRWLDFYPEAQTQMLPNAGHYLLEDEPQQTENLISTFFKQV